MYSQNILAPNFSSVFIEFEISCKTLGKVSTSIFYSFAHNTNQVVGIQNVINLGQLLNSEELEIKVNMSEFSLHSAVMHYLSDNFSSLYKRDYNEN